MIETTSYDFEKLCPFTKDYVTITVYGSKGPGMKGYKTSHADCDSRFFLDSRGSECIDRCPFMEEFSHIILQ